MSKTWQWYKYPKTSKAAFKYWCRFQVKRSKKYYKAIAKLISSKEVFQQEMYDHTVDRARVVKFLEEEISRAQFDSMIAGKAQPSEAENLLAELLALEKNTRHKVRNTNYDAKVSDQLVKDWRTSLEYFLYEALPNYHKLPRGNQGKVILREADGLHIHLPLSATRKQREDFEDFLHKHLRTHHPEFVDILTDPGSQNIIEDVWHTKAPPYIDFYENVKDEGVHFIVPRAFSIEEYIAPQLSEMGFDWQYIDQTVTAPLQFPPFLRRLRYFQEEIAVAAKQLRTIVCGYMTGRGKTTAGNYAMHQLGQKTLLVVDRTLMANQLEAEIRECIGHKIDIRQWHGLINPEDRQLGDITIMVTNSQKNESQTTKLKSDTNEVILKAYDLGLFSHFGTVIFDEGVFTMLSLQASQIVWRIPCRYVLALDAKIVRKDSLNCVQTHIQGRVIESADVQFRADENNLRFYTDWREPAKFRERLSRVKDSRSKNAINDYHRIMMEALVDADIRTQKIVIKTINLYKTEQKPGIILYCERKAWMKKMQECFQNMGYEVPSLSSDNRPKDNQEVINGFIAGDIPILITGAMITKGLDTKRAYAIVYSHPINARAFQTRGRALRRDRFKLEVMHYVCCDRKDSCTYGHTMNMIRVLHKIMAEDDHENNMQVIT